MPYKNFSQYEELKANDLIATGAFDLFMDALFKQIKDGYIINIKVQPRSSRPEVVGIVDNALKVKLKSPPVEGKANKELIEVLAHYLGIKKSQVEIISGQKSKNKVVKVMADKLNFS